MYLQIKKATLEKNTYGKNDIKITMIGLYNDNGKWIKRIPLTVVNLEKILSGKIVR